VSEFIGSETIRPAPPGIIGKRETDRNNNTTVWQGCCSACGDYLEPSNWSVCTKKNDLICKDCKMKHESRSFCPDHFASDVITKQECKALWCFYANFPPSKITLMSTKEIEKALKDLEAREYLVTEKSWFSSTRRITDKGFSALNSGICAYADEADFKRMMELSAQ
jgi:hypothetical protein